MNQVIRNLTSLTNLKQAKLSGQIATLLMLMITAVLLFILVTVNLGNLSLEATKLSNAADSASLSLASMLATKANMLNDALKQAEKDEKGAKYSAGPPPRLCRPTGLLAAFLAVVFSIFVTIVVPGIGAALGGNIIAGALAGAVGGAIGGGIAGTGVLYGAIQGAMIGASVGWGVNAGAGRAGLAGAEFATPSAVDVTTGTVGTLARIPAGSVAISGLTSTLAIPGGILAAGGGMFNAAMDDKRSIAGFSALVKELNKLPEDVQYRERIALDVLSQLVDDPNKIQDSYDANGNGDTQEMIPYFLFWWDRRVNDFKNAFVDLGPVVDAFVNGQLSKFQAVAEATYASSSGIFSRQEVEVEQVDGQEVPAKDGAVTELLRALYKNGYLLGNPSDPLWKPGPDTKELDDWEKSVDDCDCEDPPPPPKEFDELDLTIAELKNFVADSQEVKNQASTNLSDLVNRWQSDWSPSFFDPNSTDDYYHNFNSLIYGEGDFKGLIALKNEIEMTKQTLLQCTLDPNTGEINNAPCKGIDANSDFATINPDSFDEFRDVRTKLDNLIQEIQDFRTALGNFYYSMKAIQDSASTNFGGINPITYSPQDNRCPKDVNDEDNDGDREELTKCNSINVEIGFRMPGIVPRRTGGNWRWLKGKICLELQNSLDNDGSNTYVTIDQKHPVDKELKSGAIPLGKWNPSVGNIKRTSRAYYGLNKVGIARRD